MGLSDALLLRHLRRQDVRPYRLADATEERFLLAIFVGVGVLWRGWLLMGPTEAGGLCGCFGKLHLSRAGFELPPCATTCFSARAGLQ